MRPLLPILLLFSSCTPTMADVTSRVVNEALKPTPQRTARPAAQSTPRRTAEPTARPTARPTAPPGPTLSTVLAEDLADACAKSGWPDFRHEASLTTEPSRPRLQVTSFEDETEEELDLNQLQSVFEARLRRSHGLSLVASAEDADFKGIGVVRRQKASAGEATLYIARVVFVSTTDADTSSVCETTVSHEL